MAASWRSTELPPRLARTSISPVASFVFSVPASRAVTLPFDAEHELVAHVGRDLMRSRRLGRVDDDLRQAMPIAQVDEDQLPQVAAPVDPSGQGHLGARIGKPQLAARVGAVGGSQGVGSLVSHRLGIVLERMARTEARPARSEPGRDKNGVPRDRDAAGELFVRRQWTLAITKRLRTPAKSWLQPPTSCH